MDDCIHGKQKFKDGDWVCQTCGCAVESEPTDPSDYGSIRINGLEALKVFRDYGKTEREMTKDNIERFRAEKGYDPVPVSDSGRWI